MSPDICKRVVLEEEMVLALEVDESVGIVHPITLR
ncbi:MAG: hypothetical protein RJA40_833 [Actinomycetota bacterium]